MSVPPGRPKVLTRPSGAANEVSWGSFHPSGARPPAATDAPPGGSEQRERGGCFILGLCRSGRASRGRAGCVDKWVLVLSSGRLPGALNTGRSARLLECT